MDTNNTNSVRGAPRRVANRLHGQRTGAISWRPVLRPIQEDRPIPTRHYPEMLTMKAAFSGVVVVVDPTPPTCCQQSPAPESCGSQQSLPPGGKERLHFVGIRPEVQARKGGW